MKGVQEFENKKIIDMTLIKRNSDWFFPSRMDNVIDRFFNENLTESKSTFNPRVDIAETKKGFEIDLAVPGFDKKGFDIDLKDGLLSISGERKFEKKEDDKNFYSIQTEYGKFKKSFQLPDNIDAEKIVANYKNGLLSVFVPKDETKKVVSKITVK